MSGTEFTLNEKQRTMARYALGFDKGHETQKSYRNRYYVGVGGDGFAEWQKMVEAGLAEQADNGGDRKSVMFYLTLEGAQAVLNDGETLDPEDFPSSGAGLAA